MTDTERTARFSAEHPAPIALLTDFGTRDVYVGVMKGVILGIAPGAALVDLTHDVPAQNVFTGAWLLSTAWRSFPSGTVFLSVVDPGVGTDRRAIALRAGDYAFVGPDNGLFSFVLAASPAGTVRAVTLDNPRYHLPNPSATFHGRDIFAPVAAQLAIGTPLDALGTPIAPESLVRLPLLQPVWQGGELHAHVVHIDSYGNLITSLGPELTTQVLTTPSARVTLAGHTIATRAATFAAGPVGEPFLLRDSSGSLAIAVRNGSAAAQLGAHRSDPLVVTGVPAPGQR